MTIYIGIIDTYCCQGPVYISSKIETYTKADFDEMQAYYDKQFYNNAGDYAPFLVNDTEQKSHEYKTKIKNKYTSEELKEYIPYPPDLLHNGEEIDRVQGVECSSDDELTFQHFINFFEGKEKVFLFYHIIC